MSSGLEAYLVRPDTLRAAIGSADAGVIYAAGQARLPQTDHVATVGLIHGRAPEEHPLRALRALCRVVGGEMLPNDRWMPCSTRFYDAVDEALEAAGVKARVWDLPFGISAYASQLGVELPTETRAAGYSTTDVREMRTRFAGFELVSADFKDAVAQATSWFDAAVTARTGLLIVGV